MKTGDTIDVRKVGTDRWTACQVDLASGNMKSLAVSADEGLPLGALNRHTMRQTLILLLMPDGKYEDIATGFIFEIRPSAQGRD